jgi:hypothetical protein
VITPTPAPDSPVDSAGRIRPGVFNTPFRRVNMHEAELRKAGMRMPARLADLRLKEWHHQCVLLDELLLSFAVVDAKFLWTSWVHVAERDGEHFEHARKGPKYDAGVGGSLWDESSWLRASGYEVVIDSALDRGEHRVRIVVDPRGKSPAVKADLRCIHDLDAIQPLVVVLPVGRNRGMYSHKVPLPVEGTVTVGDRTYTADPATAVAILDVHKAHYPHRTFWNWATCAGHLADGRAAGLNLTRNVNRDDARYNENALWLDGRLHSLGPARFEFDSHDLLAPWRLGTDDDAVELTFVPHGERKENTNLGVVRSSFHQPYGTFSGTVKAAGETVRFDDLWGVCEDHQAAW